MTHSAFRGIQAVLVGLNSLSGLLLGQIAYAQDCNSAVLSQEHYLPVNADTVHWGYFSHSLEPRLVIHSGDTVSVETLTHHANDDASRVMRALRVFTPGRKTLKGWTVVELVRLIQTFMKTALARVLAFTF